MGQEITELWLLKNLRTHAVIMSTPKRAYSIRLDLCKKVH